MKSAAVNGSANSEGHWWRQRRTRLEGAAAARAAGRHELHPELRNPDNLAHLLAGPAFRLALLPGLRKATEKLYESTFPGLYSFHIARTKEIDSLLLDELAAGAKQVVILGAGFDTRAYRFGDRMDGVSVFEVDYPETLEWKRKRLARAGSPPKALYDVPLDLDTQPIDRALSKAGYRNTIKTVFLWESVTPYLSPRHVDAVLRLVADAHVGSSIVFDYVFRRALDEGTSLFGAKELVRYARNKSEPYVFGIDPDEIKGFLEERGLGLVSNALPQELSDRHFGDAPRRFGARMLEYAGIAQARVGDATAGRDRDGAPRAPVASEPPSSARRVVAPAPDYRLQHPIINTLRYVIDPYRGYEYLKRTYGDPIWLPLVPGTVVLTGEPDGARDVYSATPDHFDVYGRETLGAIFGPNAVMMLSEDKHRRERKLLNPRFHGTRMRAYSSIMQRAATRRSDELKVGDAFVMQPLAKTISREIIIRVVFGVVTDERFDEFQRVLYNYALAGRPSVIFFNSLRRNLHGIGPWDELTRATEALDALIYREIDQRRRTASDSDEDVLGLLLSARYDDGEKMSDIAIRDEIMGLTLAGYATTAIALSWAMYWLHQHPAILDRLRDEVTSVRPGDPEALTSLPYLEAVVNETLRLYPLIPDVYRLLRKPLMIRGQLVPAGYGVCVATALLHHREETFPDSYAFKPDRFLGKQYSPFEYAPFGGGTRRCLGAALAQYELKIVLGTLLQRCAFELLGPERPARQGLAMGPKHGVRLRLARRLVTS